MKKSIKVTIVDQDRPEPIETTAGFCVTIAITDSDEGDSSECQVIAVGQLRRGQIGPLLESMEKAVDQILEGAMEQELKRLQEYKARIGRKQ